MRKTITATATTTTTTTTTKIRTSGNALLFATGIVSDDRLEPDYQ